MLGQLAIFSKLGREVGVGFLLIGIAGVGASSGVGSTRVARVVLLLLLFLFLLELGVVVLLAVVPFPLSLEHSGFGVLRVSLATSKQHFQ